MCYIHLKVFWSFLANIVGRRRRNGTGKNQTDLESSTIYRRTLRNEPTAANQPTLPDMSAVSARRTENPLQYSVSSSEGSAGATKVPEIKHLTPRSPLLFDALFERNFSLAEALIEENRGLLFVSQVHSGNTVLHTAALYNAPTHLIRLLVEKGADVNKPNDMGRTAVYLAARHNVSNDTMKYLVSVGGEINKRDIHGYTPLMAASYNGSSLRLVGLLLALGADRAVLDTQGRKASDWAAEGAHIAVAKYLDNIGTIEVMCQAYHSRVGNHSTLRILPKEIIMRTRDALFFSNTTPKVATGNGVAEGDNIRPNHPSRW